MPPASAPAPTGARVELADRVSDMFDYLARNGNQGTIECAPAPGEEGTVLQHFLDGARERGLCVHSQAQHGWLMFHAHTGGHE